MKKLFGSKNIISKIALILIIIILFQTIIPKPVNAAGIGGTLLSPIISLVVALADGVMDLLQDILLTPQDAFIEVDLNGVKSTFGELLVFVIGGIVCFAAAAIFLGATIGVAALTTMAAKVGVGLLIKIGVGAGAAGTVAWLLLYPKIGPVINQICFGNSFTYTNIGLTPETILSDQIPLFNVNFFQEIVVPEAIDERARPIYDLAITIRGLVKGVYSDLAVILLLAMSIVLVYIGIKAYNSLLQPTEKSKYQKSFVNCLKGIALIVVMHFVMSIGTSVATMITQSIVTKNYECPSTEEEIKDKMEDVDEDGRIADREFEQKYTAGETISLQGTEIYNAFVDKGWIPLTSVDDEIEDEYPKAQIGDADEHIINIVAANFLESARYKAQKIYDTDPNNSEEIRGNWDHIGWSFVYIMLVILTVAFVYMYGKRFLYVAALTMFAPIVGIMYPINKADGSRAQTLNLWFREYIGNLVMQPFHLFLYTILINGAMAAAINNPIYVIIALMGIVFIERLLKDLIGIQDTRIGGLGNALNDTNRAIKNATSAARDIGRKVARTAKGAVKMGVGIAEKTLGDAEENGAENPRMQPPPLAAANEESQEETLQRRPDPDDPNSMQVSRDPMDVHEEESLAFNSFEESQPESLYSGDEDYIDQLRAQGYTEEEIQEQMAALEEVRAAEKRLEEEAEAKRLAEQVSPEEEAELLRAQLRTQGYSDEEIEEQIRDQIGEIPRIGANESELRAEQANQIDEEMEPAELAEAMRRTGMSEEELLHRKTIDRDYNPRLAIGENASVDTNPNAQIPSFLDPEIASRVAQEKMAEIEERGGQRYTSKSGIEAVRTGEDGNTIVADFTTIHSKTGDKTPVGTIAQEIPQEVAVGQDFMPDMNKGKNINSNLRINEPIARGGDSALNVEPISGTASTEGFSGGNAARVKMHGISQGPIEYTPAGVKDSETVIPEDKRRTIQFNPQSAETIKNNVSARVQEGGSNAIQFNPQSAETIKDSVSARVQEGGSNAIQFNPQSAETIKDSVSARVQEGGSNTIQFNPQSAETIKNNVSGRVQEGGSNAIQFNPQSAETIKNNVSASVEEGGSNAIQFNPQSAETIKNNVSARVQEGGSATGRKEPIKFTPPEAEASAQYIPEDRRRVITYDPTSSNRRGGTEIHTPIEPVENPRQSTVTRAGSGNEETIVRNDQGSPTRVNSTSGNGRGETEIHTPIETVENPRQSTVTRAASGNEETRVRNDQGSQTRVNPTSSNRRGGTEIHTPIEPVENPGQSTVSSARNSNGGNQPSVRDSSRADATVPEPTQAGPRRKKLSQDAVEELTQMAGAAVGGVATRAGGGVLNIIEAAGNVMAGQPAAAVEQTRSVISGAASDIAAIADAGGRATEFKGAGQMSSDAHHMQRELNIKAEEARLIDRYCEANKIQDKQNKTIVAEMYGKSDKKDMVTFIQLAAEVIKAKKTSRTENDVKSYLNSQGISSKNRDALLDVFKKARK